MINCLCELIHSEYKYCPFVSHRAKPSVSALVQWPSDFRPLMHATLEWSLQPSSLWWPTSSATLQNSIDSTVFAYSEYSHSWPQNNAFPVIVPLPLWQSVASAPAEENPGGLSHIPPPASAAFHYCDSTPLPFPLLRCGLVCGWEEVPVIRPDKNKHLANTAWHGGRACTHIAFPCGSMTGQSAPRESVPTELSVHFEDCGIQKEKPRPKSFFKIPAQKKKNQWAFRVHNEWLLLEVITKVTRLQSCLSGWPEGGELEKGNRKKPCNGEIGIVVYCLLVSDYIILKCITDHGFDRADLAFWISMYTLNGKLLLLWPLARVSALSNYLSDTAVMTLMHPFHEYVLMAHSLHLQYLPVLKY